METWLGTKATATVEMSSRRGRERLHEYARLYVKTYSYSCTSSAIQLFYRYIVIMQCKVCTGLAWPVPIALLRSNWCNPHALWHSTRLSLSGIFGCIRELTQLYATCIQLHVCMLIAYMYYRNARYMHAHTPRWNGPGS